MTRSQTDLKIDTWWSADIDVVRAVFAQTIATRFPNKENESRILEALELATAAHAGIERKGGGPYIIHPLRVCLIVLFVQPAADAHLACAALLHDVIEDSSTSFADRLRREFPEIFDLVSAVTRIGPKDERGPSGDQPECPYLRKVKTGGVDAILIKLADKMDNLRDSKRLHNPAKVPIYLDETIESYLPLLRNIQDRDLAGRLQTGIITAMEIHKSLFRRAATKALERWIGTHVATSPQLVPTYIPSFNDVVAGYHLVNPGARFWITTDAAQVVVTQPDSVHLARNSAATLLSLLRGGQVGNVAELFGLPDFFNPSSLQAADARTKMERKWQRVEAQLEEFICLLNKEPPVPWIAPLKEPDANEWLLLALHSLMFHSANWHYPIWQDDYGSQIAADGGARFTHVSDNQAQREGWANRLVFLLKNRGALLRLEFGEGDLPRVREVVSQLPATSSSASPSAGWAARLAVEYLDAFEDSAAHATADSLWTKLKGSDFNALRLQTRDLAKKLRADLVGHRRVTDIFEDRRLNRILTEKLDRLRASVGDAEPVWLVVDGDEIKKRWPDLEPRIKNRLPVNESDRFPFAVTELRGGAKTFAIHIAPGKDVTLKNRLPEITESELSAIAARGFSAVSIFDTLLLKKLNASPREPLWMPRVYRILDSMEALDPAHVQKISVFLESGESLVGLNAEEAASAALLSRFETYLPLPAEARDAGCQIDRKKFIARYVATHVYNCGVVRRLRGARFECAEAGQGRNVEALADDEKWKVDQPLSDDDLASFISIAEKEQRLRSSYGHYVECVNFEPFDIHPGSGDDFETSDFTFTPAAMREEGLFFLGIDIGGTDVKACLFQNGDLVRDPSLVRLPLLTFRTFEKEGDNDCGGFFARIAEQMSSGLFAEADKIWPKIRAIGLAWPGAVRASRIVGSSRALGRLSFNGRTLAQNVPPAELHRLDLIGVFKRSLSKFADARNLKLDETLACVLVNDGDAEALGNFCLQELAGSAGSHLKGGALVIKFGTSLAGGRIDARGAIADDVAEFAKPVLDLNGELPAHLIDPAGVARNYVSSIGVRRLSSEFKFGGQPLFGTRNGANAENRPQTRIESVELGLLLPLWKSVDGQARWLDLLLEHNNQPQPTAIPEFVKWIEAWEKKSAGDIQNYVEKLAAEWRKRPRSTAESEAGSSQSLLHLLSTLARAGSEPAQKLPDGLNLLELFKQGRAWCQGLRRAWWMCEPNAPPPDEALPAEGLPPDFPKSQLAWITFGSVALFSQLALQTAHLIALLYNIYRRGTFTRVILAGGVLNGETGELLRRQTAGFLENLYDKISPKHLAREAITLARLPADFGLQAVGPFGSAMAANRQHKLEALAVMRKQLENLVHETSPGDRIAVAEATSRCLGLRVSRDDIIRSLQVLAAHGVLAPASDGSFHRV